MDGLKDIHDLEGAPAELRALLLDIADSDFAGGFAQSAVNDMIDRMNAAIGAQHMTAATAMLSMALMARGLIVTAADWWAEGRDPRSTRPNTTAALRSFITDLPPWISGYSVGEDGRE